MDIKLDRELLKLHSLNFQRAPDIKDALENLLIENELTIAEIGLSSAKIFQSDQGFFQFLEKHVGSRDPLLAESRKMLYKLMAQYIKQYKDYCVEYLESIYENCLRLFKREDSNKSKDASLRPIIMMMKSYDQQILTPILAPQRLGCILLDEIKFCKPSATVKGTIFQGMGRLSQYLEMNEQRNVKEETFLVAMGTLEDQLKSPQPELSVIQGLLKYFRFGLRSYQPSQEQKRFLFNAFKTFMIPIKDVSSLKIPNGSVKLFRDNIQIFENELIQNAEGIFNQLMNLLQNVNRDLKENSSELLDKFIEFLSEKLNNEVNYHRRIFNKILDRFCEVLGNSKQQDLFSLTVVIRSVGQFAGGIKKLRGERQLAQFFDHLNELGEKKINEIFSYSINTDGMKKGIHFKVILYRQKQLNSFLSSYSNLVKHLTTLSDKQVHHLFDLCLMCIKQHYNYFQNYKPYMYESMANFIVAIQGHEGIGRQFMEKLFSQGSEEALVYHGEQYIKTCEEVAKLWIGIIQQKIWSNHTLSRFCDCIYSCLNELLQKTSFEYRQEKSDLTFKLVPENPKQITDFHRFTLMLSLLFPKMPPLNLQQLILLLKNLYSKIKKHPKAILLLIFCRIIFSYLNQYNLIKDNITLLSFVSKIMHLILDNLKLYTHQLRNEALTLLLSVPLSLIINNNYSLLRQHYISILIQSLKENTLPLASYAIDLLIAIIQEDRKNAYKFKQMLKLLSNVIPYLSQYMQHIQESDDIIPQTILIDTTYPYKFLLSELNITRELVVEKVTEYLGSIGGLSHMIVEDIQKESLLKWDYNSPITFPLPLGAKTLQISLGSMLERVLVLCIDSPTDKVKVLSSELLHAFIIYLLGSSINDSVRQLHKKDQEKINKLKQEYAGIYKRVFPVMIQIANSLYHPCKEYFTQLLQQITHWFANSRQYEAPDVTQLLDSLFEAPIQDTQLLQYCSTLVGEFIHWTLKQMSQEELVKNYSNIKTVYRRIITYLNHPDQTYKNMGLHCLEQMIYHTQNEEFLVQKYFIDLTLHIKQGAILIKQFPQIIKILSQALKRFEIKNARGRFSTLAELLDFLYEEAYCNKEGQWNIFAMELWHNVAGDIRQRMIQVANLQHTHKLFPKIPIQRLKFDKSDLELAESLQTQCRVWIYLKERGVFNQKELSQLEDFKITVENIEQFLQFFYALKNQIQQQYNTQIEESPLFDIMFTITQENFNPSQNDRLSQFINQNISEQLIESLVIIFSMVFKFVYVFQLNIQEYQKMLCGLLIKPNYYLMGLSLENNQINIEELFNSIYKVLDMNHPSEQIINESITMIYDKPFKDIIQQCKDPLELKYYLKALQYLKPKGLVQMIENTQQLLKQDMNLEFRQLLFDFLLQSCNADLFIIESLKVSSELRQSSERQLINYIANRFQDCKELYFEKAKDDITLIRYALMIITKEKDQKTLLNNIRFKSSRSNEDILMAEIQFKYTLLSYVEEIHSQEYEDLLNEALLPHHPVEIHLEALLLYGLYCKRTQILLNLNNIKNKYFPLKVTDLQKDSQQYINFKAIMNKIQQMIKISYKIELLEVLFPLIKQEIEFDFSDFKVEYSHIKWIMQNIQDQELDRNLLDNVRIELGNKFLIPFLLIRQDLLLQFYMEYTSYLLTQLTQKSDDNWHSVIYFLKWQSLIWDLFGIAFRCLSSDQIKNELHPKLYKNSQGNELTKKLISELTKIRKNRFDKIYIFEAHQKELNGIDYLKLISDYHCSAYIALIYVMMATQTKENLFVQFLFQFRREQGEQMWDNLIPKNWQFDFQVETSFREIPIMNEFAKNSNLEEQVIQRYITTATLGTYAIEVEDANSTTLQPQQESYNQESKSYIELDDVNKHKLMIPFLKLIDFLNEKFPVSQQEMPGWMTCLYQELAIEQPLPIKVFLIKLLINRVKVFEKFGSNWIDPLLQYCTKENKPNGGKGFHYFLRDAVVSVIQFSMNAEVRNEYVRLFPRGRERLCSVVNNLILLTAHSNKKLFNQNIEILTYFGQNFKQHLYVCDQSITKMISNHGKPDSDLWILNGLEVLRVALLNGILILTDYQDFIRSQTIHEKYRYILQHNAHNLPSETLYKLAINYNTKKNILKAIGGLYGAIMQACTTLNSNDGLQYYELEILKISQGILSDTRPGYGKKKFTDFLRCVTQYYPKILNGKLFMMAADLITQATSSERAQILFMFEAYLAKIENFTTDANYYISQIVVSISGSIQQIVVDQELSVHYATLALLKQLAQLKCLNICTNDVLKCFRDILPRIDQSYAVHYDVQIVSAYHDILCLLHEYLSNHDDLETQQTVTDHLLALFVSQHDQIRKACFEYFQKDMENKTIKLNYLQKAEGSQMDRVIQLMQDIYQPKKENLWLRGAVPLLLSSSKRNSDYEKTFFDKNLDEEAHYYDIEFRGQKHFKKQNLSQFTQGGNYSTLLSQVIAQPGIRATQLQDEGFIEQQVQPQQTQASQFSQFSQDQDGFKIPQKKKKNLSQFLQSNEISFSQIQINANNRLRYVPENTQASKEKSQQLFIKRVENKFAKNQVRKYRKGELPDILIKRKDIIDPLIELCFEDEEMSGRMFTCLFDQLQYHENDTTKLQNILVNLLDKSIMKEFMFISTILRTIYQVVKRSRIPFKEGIIKKIGLESLAYYQSMILIEEQIIILEEIDEDNLNEEQKQIKESNWMDLIDLHQHQGNQAQIQGIMDLTFSKNKNPFADMMNNCMNLKDNHDYANASEAIKEMLDKIDQSMGEIQIELESLDARMQRFLQEEYDDTLRKLGKWDELDQNVVEKVCSMSELEIIQNTKQVRKAFNKLLRVGPDGNADLIKLNHIYRKVQHSIDPFVLEVAQMFQADVDVDQARFYIQLCKKQFINKWSQLINQNALLSKPLRHKHLEQLQLIHEICEIQRAFKGNEIDQEVLQEISDAWAIRRPHYIHDSLDIWIRVYENRKLITSQIPIQQTQQAQWAIQCAKGMMKMNLLDQALMMLNLSYSKKKKGEFNWDFYSTIAQVKLKQLEQKRISMDFMKCIEAQDLKVHEDYARLFANEYQTYESQIKQEEIKFKFRMLPLKCYDNYIKINQDLIFLLQKMPQYRGNPSVTQFYDKFSTILQQTLLSYEDANKHVIEGVSSSKFYSVAAFYCERCLRLLEPESGGCEDLRKLLERKKLGIDNIAYQFVRYTINSFKTSHIDSKLSNLLIKLIKVVQKFPQHVGDLFQDALKKHELSSHHFLQYLPQMIHIISNDKLMTYFKQIFTDFISTYPQQFVYQFNVIYEFEEDCKNVYSKKIYQDLQQRVPRNHEFIQALNKLTNPQHRMVYYMNHLSENLQNKELIQQLRQDLFDRNKKFCGPANIKFANSYENKFNNLKLKDQQEILNFLVTVKSEAKEVSSGTQSISDLSPWFQNYNDDSQQELKNLYDIAMPVNLNGLTQIELKTIPKISSFDQKMLVLNSLRKPKKIKIYGSDEKSYSFLVKGIEDLRLDQRIEQLFEVMNTLGESKIATFGVFPMTKILGMCEWVEQSVVLKNLLEKEFLEFNVGDLFFENSAYKGRHAHLNFHKQKLGYKKNEKVHISLLHRALLELDDDDVISNFQDQKRFIGSMLLRNGLLSMSTNVEAFIFIRDKFLSNYAMVCASGYILGIGDRHLENFLLNYATGDVVPIDFGYSFGAGIGLAVPELMPFRLTQVFEGLAKPIGLGGTFRHEMIKIMTAFRNKRHILLDFCEVFINDPLLDQLKLAKERASSASEFLSQMKQQIQLEVEIYQKSNPSLPESSFAESRNIEEVWYPLKKIDIVRKKLIGVHCSLVLLEELEETKHHTEKYMEKLKNVVMGKNRQRFQCANLYVNKGNVLSVVEQVDCLIDIATDPNILGRTWIGWTPYV